MMDCVDHFVKKNKQTMSYLLSILKSEKLWLYEV